MNNNKRKIILGSIIGVFIGTLLSVSYAFFSYTNSQASNSQLVTGNIYMRYKEDNTLTIEEAMPRSGPIENKYFEFTIEGKNTTEDKDIWYDVVLTHGGLPENSTKTEDNRIEDKYLRFKLVEVINNSESIIENNIKYNTLTNRRIYVNKIEHGTEPNRTYRLYMWIDNSVGIGNTSDARYSISEWNNLFASIKVNVTGDFNEKYVTTNPSCFTYTVNDNKVIITGYDVSCGGTNVIIPNIIEEKEVTEIGDYAFAGKSLSSIEMLDGILTIGQYGFVGTGLTNLTLPDSLITIKGNAFNHNNLVGGLVIPDKVVTIGNNAFTGNKLSSVVIPESVSVIGENAFLDNRLTNVTILDSAVTIGRMAFAGETGHNEISNLILGNNIREIGQSAFKGNTFSVITIPNSIDSWSCSAFDNSVIITNNSSVECTS